MKKLALYTTIALIAFAPSAFATQDNSAAISGSNNDLIQQTGTGNVLATGPGAFGTTNTGGAGGNATATGGTGGSVIGSGNSSNVNTALGGAGGQGGRGGDGGTGIGTGVGIGGNSSATGGNQSQSATTGNQSVNFEAKRIPVSTAYAPGLVAGFDCLGSKSGGVSFAPVSISAGGTEADPTFVNVFVSRYLAERGEAKESWLAGCFIEQVRVVRALAGNPCPNLEGVASSARSWEAESTEWRDRSGYPASGNTSKH